ncbi:MAG: carboxypeptidase regulatory-like domain-containing protein, partial [Gammaproteobacteria bacterium]
MKSWRSKLVAATAALGLCAGVALAQTDGLMTINHQKSAPALLKQATLVGHHPKDSTLNLTFSLKRNHAAQLNAVVQFLKQHGITVKNITPNRALIYTEASTGTYEHALLIMINDYTLKGQTFISSPDVPKLPAAVARYVNGVFQTVPLHLVPGHFSPARLTKSGKSGQSAVPAWMAPPALAPSQSTAAWSAVADYPIPVLDNCAATDESSGTVYSVGGDSNVAVTDAAYAYDPTSESWSAIASLPEGLEKPACAFIGGKLYVTAGWDSSGNNNSTLYIYDPSSGTWSTGASMTVSVGGAPGYAVLSGDLYVIGGCGNSSSCPGTTGVEVYDPSSDSWSTAADYPEGISWTGCGGTQGEVYCGGGVNAAGTGDTSDAYAYNPGSNSWTQIASLAYDNWGMSAIATADGHLLFSMGVTGGFATITNQGQSYDVASNSWSMLPNNLVTTYRAAGACGFYTIGGMDSGNTFTGIQNVQVLPGYNVCAISGPTGVVNGTVTDSSSGNPISGATLTFTPDGGSTVTNSDGQYSITLATGTYTETASAFGYEPQSVSVTVTDGGTTTQDFALQSSSAATLNGIVYDTGHHYPLFAHVVIDAG